MITTASLTFIVAAALSATAVWSGFAGQASWLVKILIVEFICLAAASIFLKKNEKQVHSLPEEEDEKEMDLTT